MKLSALLVLAFGLLACSQSQEDQTRAQARQTAEQLKHDSQKALHTAEVDARKADAELTHSLDKTREKARRALNQPDDGRPDDKDSR
jgi:ABC-type nickel/cobalt efflux system permease component RcnA